MNIDNLEVTSIINIESQDSSEAFDFNLLVDDTISMNDRHN